MISCPPTSTRSLNPLWGNGNKREFDRNTRAHHLVIDDKKLWLYCVVSIFFWPVFLNGFPFANRTVWR